MGFVDLILSIFAAAYNYETPHSTLYFIGSAVACTKLFEHAQPAQAGAKTEKEKAL